MNRFNSYSLKRYYARVIIIVFLLFAGNILVFAQIPGSIERKQLFDYSWKFFLGDTASARSKEFDDKNWRSLDLPHDWSIEGKINPKNPTGGAGGYFPAGVGWYRKTFPVPKEWKDKNISIYFEGVYMNSEIFINGKSLGIYPYGYSPFSYNLSAYLDFGNENVIAVRVDNSQQVNCRWYSGSGIYRHVWMMVTDPIHVADGGVAITTPDVSSKKATIQIKTVIKNETGLSQSFFLKTRLLAANAKDAGNNQIKVELAANNEKEITQAITVSDPLLWTPETPHLYTARIQLLKNKKVVDDTKTNFGIRTIQFTAENGFRLNGKTVKMNGGCVHHDNGCLGAAAFDRAEERRVELLKAAGFNAIRTSHNLPSEAFLDACDRLGLLVIDEAFDGWKEKKNQYDYARYFDQWWKRDLDAMVLRDRNHPSVIMWSTGNEIIERKKPEAVETAKMLANAIKKIDPTRPVTSAMTTWDKDWEIFDPLMTAHDVCGYNYQLHRASYDHQRVPSRIIVQTESYPADAFANWNLVQNNNYIIGDFVWTALDYLGESGIGRWYYSGDVPGEHWEHDFFPWHGAYCGDIDLTGWRKPISHYRSLLYNNTEKLYMAVREPDPEPLEIKRTLWSVWPTWESWSWPEYKGKDIQVEVYSKYPGVRLYLNDKLIGEKATTKEQEYKATFTLSWSPGVLKAVGVENNKEIESTILQTSGDAAKIKLTADRKEIVANGQDLCYVTIEITDKDGIFQPNATNRLHFKIDGPGIIAGIDNADVKDTDPYVGDSRKAWHGRALVVIRSTHSIGDIKLMVSSSGLSGDTVNIKTFSEKSSYTTRQPGKAKVDGGWIQGTVENDLIVFKGIPFAAPPVGELRWRAPQPVKKWDNVKQTTSFAPAPMQGGNPPSGKSEDCLYLNVWTPAKSAKERLPVLVWIYGGGFSFGSTAEPWFNGEKLAKKGVVFVSIAYRVGQLGFLAHPELSAENRGHVSGNYGLLDQVAGLKWIQKNIAAFGGDPNKVTIFGESAGAISVSMLCASPLAKGLFHGAISQSGGSFGPTRPTTFPGENMKTLKQAETAGHTYLQKAGASSIAELRKIDADKLPSGWGLGSAWPIVDGYVIPDDQYKLYKAGKYNDVPVIMGYNSDEGASFSPGKTPEEYVSGVKTRYGKFADALIKAYPVGENSVPKTARDLARDAAFGWHTWSWARLQSKTGKSKVYYYYFDQHPDYPVGSPQHGYGSPHAQDVSYVFQHIDPSNPQTTKSDLEISEAMGTYWTNFAKVGNPNGKGVPEWPAFYDANPVVMYFGPTPHTGPVPGEKSLKVLDEYFMWRFTPEGEAWAK